MAGYRPGQLAKGIIRGYGDIDLSTAGEGARRGVLEKIRIGDIQAVEARGKQLLRKPKQRLAKAEDRLKQHEERFARRQAQVLHRRQQSELWRQAHVQQWLTTVHVPPLLRAFTLCALAIGDFYVFAEAFAASENIAFGSSRWWLGGMLGLFTFVAGYYLAHHIKLRILSTAQARLESGVRAGKVHIDLPLESLHRTHTSDGQLVFLVTLFAVLVVIGGAIRLSSGDLTNLWTLALQALVPVVAVFVEIYLYDPTEVREPRPRVAHRLSRLGAVRARKQVDLLEERVGIARDRVNSKYDLEAAILEVEYQDLGLHRKVELS